tara:strand:+ start:12261 stop:12491 length:231 start_codon:yes stop_codon:yes gene_type:complete
MTTINSLIVLSTFLFLPVNSNFDISAPIDPLDKAIENKTCSTMLTGWDVSVNGEWEGNKFIVTITCSEGGTDDCPS